ncbi:MAG TPA: hypothetical protein VE081_07540 [Sporichthyaceae bacterium]|nr:hypothetical protein [Sporichthyaceae bacterium]
MRRTQAAVSAGLSLALLAAGVEGARALAPSAAADAPASGAAESGTLVAHLDDPRTVAVPYDGAESQARLSVSVGQHVHAGQELAATADEAVRQAVRDARVNLTLAQQQAAAAAAPPTVEQVQLDRANIRQAELAYRSMCLALRQAEQHADYDWPDQHAILGVARHKVLANLHDRSRVSENIDNHERSRSQTVAPPPPATATTTDFHRSLHNDRATALQTRSAIAGAQLDLAYAEHGLGVTLLNDVQQLHQLRAQVAEARNRVWVAVAQKNFNEHNGQSTAKGALHRARKQARIAQSLAQSSVVRAPVDAVVVSVVGPDRPGPTGSGPAALLAGGLLASPGAGEAHGYIVLADQTHRSVTARVPRHQAGTVVPGQQTTVSFPATGATVPGVVSEVDHDGARAFRVHIDLDDRAGGMALGRSATVRILAADQPAAVAVPSAALIPAGRGTLLAVQRGGDVLKLPVTVAESGPTQSLVHSGFLKPGDLVITPEPLRPRRSGRRRPS